MTPYGKIWLVLNIICWVPLRSVAQQFKYMTELDTVKTTGFYSIDISPELTAHIKTDFSDIRIMDKNKQWVPHILQPVKESFTADLFTAFPILENTITDSGKNLLIIENANGQGIGDLLVFLKNAAVSRTAVLSGSNNSREWFIIDDQVSIGRSNETKKDEYLQEIDFPLARYRYLRLVIDNMHNDPLLITRAGWYSQPHYKKPTSYQDNPLPAFKQTDSNKHSYIEVRQKDRYQFDKISLGVSGSKFYDRDLQVCLPGFTRDTLAKPGIVLGNFKLLSGSPAIFELPKTSTGLFFLVIKNGDNPPLKVEKIVTQQQTVSLLTYLEQGKKYELLFGDSLASFADYDLQTFKDSITGISPLRYGKVYPIKKIIPAITRTGKSWWLWTIIVFAGIVLSFLTYRLLADITRQPNKQA